MKCCLGISNFLEEISVFPIVLFPLFICTDHWGRLSYLSLLFFWNSAFKWVYLFFSPVPFACFLFSAICKASSDNHFPLLHFFFLGMVLITASCTVSWTSVHSTSGALSDLIPWICLSLPLYNLRHSWMANHFSILVLRSPWTAWKGKKVWHWKMNFPGQ